MKRREFIILTGVGAATTTLLAGCGHPEEKLIPAFIPDDEYVPGLDYWKATACRMCGAGCGIVVRTREHKANKIEGNPLHPVNRGALCARGQAGLQVHYNPDQILGPKKRTGERGSGQFSDISWDEAIKTLADKMRELRSRNESGSTVLAAQHGDGVTGLVAEHFMAAVGSSRLAADQYPGQQTEAASYQESYRAQSLPVFDIAGARYLLSFGARFLETWHSPVMYSLAYARFRQGGRQGRGRFVQVEPRMSMTAANADEWLPAAPGTEGLVALGIAQVIVHESLVPGAAPPSFLQQPLDDFAPDKTANQTGIPAEKIIRVAREFAAAGGLAIGGGAALAVSEAQHSMRAINFLNSLVGNLNKPGGVLASGEPVFDALSKWRNRARTQWSPLPEQLASGAAPGAILFYRANPVFTAPWLADTIKSAPFITSFSSFMDETTMLADLILPDNSNFESWDLGTSLSAAAAPAGPVLSAEQSSLPGTRNPEAPDRAPTASVLTLAVTLARPVLSTENDTRQTADVLIAVGKELGEAMSRSLPFSSAEEIVKAAAAELQKLPGSIPESTWQSKPDSGIQQDGDSAGQFWDKFFESGVWITSARTAGIPHQSTDSGPPKPVASHQFNVTAAEQDSQHPLTLLAYDHPALGYGAEANLPWLQELPEPMTTVMWGSWIEINPKTAAAYSIEDGDLVEVRSRSASVRVPALIYPAIHPDTVAMPYGQGHTAYGMYAAGRGVNAAQLSPVLQRSAVQTETVRVSISRVSGEARLIRFGTMLPERPERPR